MTVQVRAAVADADPAQWLSGVSPRLSAADQGLVSRALLLAVAAYGGKSTPVGEPLLTHCREVAGILSGLRLDGESLAAALLSGLPAVEPGWQQKLQADIGMPVAALVDGFIGMGQMQALRAQAQEARKAAERTAQLEALRKMLLAMVQDVRVVLLKLADQTQTLRYIAGRGDERARERVARDTFDLFAPLANRLGVWQLKWELEDLAFRSSNPEAYKGIARELDEKRADRERFIAEIIRVLRGELTRADIAADVTGRPKHIYSIYTKLARQQRPLRELSDVRAVRVLVDDVKDCYAVLGLVHNLWTPLPKEFDDYIAKPKPNGYRSMHTAVVGPDQKVLEVQIRTHEMHRLCEHGVAAHWRYKEGARADRASDERIAWLRQILEWKDHLADVADLAEYFRAGSADESIYVLTPQGRVVALPKGSTPVDFAYHVHSELGHRCRGARVDGDMVPLNSSLANGQTVEIVAAKSGGPSRDWLNPDLGFTHSSRARAKVRQWFNSQNLETAIGQGRELVEKLLQREGRTALRLDVLAERMGYRRADELLVNVGRGEFNLRQLESAVRGEPPAANIEEPPALQPGARDLAQSEQLRRSGDVLVVGVDKLLTVLARCCKPAPPDPILGFVTRGRGVTVHRRRCPNVARLPAERVMPAQWSSHADQGRFPVELEVEGAGDAALMRDILDIFSREKVHVAAATSHARNLETRMCFTVEVNGLPQIRALLTAIGALPGVVSAWRR